MPPEPATKPTGAPRASSPPPARVPGNRWNEISVPEPGAFTPEQRVSVIVASEDPERLAPLTLAALSAQSYPAALCEVVAAAEPAAAREALGAGELELTLVDPLPGAEAQAAERAQGELLVFLEPGAIPERGLVEAHARWHHAVSDAVSVGRSRALDARGLGLEELADAVRRDELESLVERRLRPDPADEALAAYLELTRGLTERRPDLFRVAARTNLALRRETYRAAGQGPELPDRRLRRLDLAYRLELAGCVFVPEQAAVSFNHYPDGDPLPPQAQAADSGSGWAPDPRAESLIPVPGFRRPGAGRRFRRPAMVVHLRAGDESAAELLETVDAVLRGRLQDLELRLSLPPGHPERALIEEACSADPRIALSAPEAPPQSPYEVTLPAVAVPDERTFEDLHQLMLAEEVGALHVTVPGRLARLLRGRSGLLRSLWRGPTLEVAATGPLARARRIAAASPDGQPDPAVLLGELFGERWVSGVEVSLRRRGAPEPQGTEDRSPATDLAHERAEHLRQRARAATNQARADRQGQRSVRERMVASHERLQAERLDARLARMSPLYWLRWRGRRVARRVRALPGAVGGAFARLRQLAYRARQAAAAQATRARR